jgi:hypothetical protein
VLTCGLDRYLRVFNYKTYEDLPQIYTKTKLNVLYPLEYEVQSPKDSEDEANEEEEEMFEEEDELDEEDEANEVSNEDLIEYS